MVPTRTAMGPQTRNGDARMRESDFRLEIAAGRAPCLFPNFLLAGFECSTPINRHGVRIVCILKVEHQPQPLLCLQRGNPLDPVNLAFDKSGNLLVLSSAERNDDGSGRPCSRR